MDVITHALLGAELACASTPRRPRLQTRERLLLGGIAAAFPDIDFLGFLIDPLIFLADWHQGPTHSVLLLPLWALLIGGLFAGWTGRRGDFTDAVCVSGLGLASHIAADVITAYGTAVLYPLSHLRLSLDTTFVIDPVFTVIVLTGLVAGVWAGRRRVAGLGLAVLCLYVAGQGWLQQRAIDVGLVSAREHALEFTRLSALPQPLSPFNWKLIGTADASYYESHLDLRGHRPMLPRLPGLQRWADLAEAYRPPGGLVWRVRHRHGDRPEMRALVEQLWQEPRFAPFRRFATHPALSRIDSDGPETCIWFTDMRYDLPTLPDAFRYGFCRDSAELPWQLYRLKYFTERSRQRLSP